MGPMSRGRRDCTGRPAGPCARRALQSPVRAAVGDGAVVHGPATAPQTVFKARMAGDVIQVCLPGAG
jgi:hypothetical protein